MTEQGLNKFDLNSFRSANERMAAVNSASYNTNQFGPGFSEKLKDYTIDEIKRIINSGSLSEQQRLSRNSFSANGFYSRMIIYYATLLKYTGILIPNPSFGNKLSTPHIQKKYFNAIDFIDHIPLQTLLTNCAFRTLVDGCYYGVIQNLDKSDFAILDLPAAWCRTRFKDVFGSDLIEFNLAYFNSIFDLKERESTLSAYPDIISKAYYRWSSGKNLSKWFFIPPEIGVCFLFFENRPLFLSTIPATIKKDEILELELEREKEDIKKIVVQKIPHLPDGRMLFDTPEMEEIHVGTVGMMKGNKNLRVLTTYADVDVVTSKSTGERSSNSLDRLVQNVYNEAGVSGQLFASTGSSTLETSIKNDIALMMILGNKFSSFVTSLVNRLYSNSNIDFKYTILPITYYNEEKYMDSSFKLASSGYSFLLPALASGFSQKDLGNIKELENDVLKLDERLIPLVSSYTRSAADSKKSGAPAKEEQEKAPQTIKNEESLNNNTKKGGFSE